MEKFEIHITGDESILFHAKKLDLKTIIVILVKPDRSYFRTEFMTSTVMEFPNYTTCKRKIDEVAKALEELGVYIKRVKIECPPYPHYIEQSLYKEIHDKADDSTKNLPLSQNYNRNYFLLTDREYDKSKYDQLTKKYHKRSSDIITELCLYDSDVNEDKDWFDLYKEN